MKNLVESIRQDLIRFEGFKEEVAVDENLEAPLEEEALVEEPTTPQEWQEADMAKMQHTKAKLEELIAELDADMMWRGKHSRDFFSNGDKAGTGQLGSIIDKLQDINNNWDKDTGLYGM